MQTEELQAFRSDYPRKSDTGSRFPADWRGFCWTRKPTIIKVYISSEGSAFGVGHRSTFIVCLRRSVSRRGLPSVIMGDHGSNFIGADRELDQLHTFINSNSKMIAEFCASQGIIDKWKYIPEKSPHFGGLWEAAMKSAKTCLRKVADTIQMTYEELATVTCQVEACLNSRPLIPMLAVDCEVVEPLTPGHFLTGKPLTAIPDQGHRVKDITLLKAMVDVSTNYTAFLETVEFRISCIRWHHPKRNLQKGDVVILREDNAFVNTWPLGRCTRERMG